MWREQSGKFENEVMTGKEKIISFRVSAGLVRAIEAQAKVWNCSTSEAARDIVKFYFLPMACEMQAKEKGLKVVNDLGNMQALTEYLEFLQEASEASKNSVKFLERIISKLQKLFDTAREVVEQELELEDRRN